MTSGWEVTLRAPSAKVIQVMGQCKCAWVRACVFSSAKDLGFRVQSDGVVAFWGPRTGSRMGLTVQLPLHEEVALLLEVEVTVSTHEALGVPVLIPGLDDSAYNTTATLVTEWHPRGAASSAVDFSNWSPHASSSSRTIVRPVVHHFLEHPEGA